MSKEESNPNSREWRYHESCPEGKIFTGDDAIAEADKAGWKDHPHKLDLPEAAGTGEIQEPLLDTERQGLQDELADAQDNLDTVTEALEAAQAKITEQAESLKAAEADTAALNTKVKSLTSQLAAANKKAK